MTPIYTYVYCEVFKKRNGTILNFQETIIEVPYFEMYGFSLGVLSWITFMLFRKLIADFFVYKLLRIKKPNIFSKRQKEKTYFESYRNYY